jgi:ABC transport system ATP-binding/permease protein
MGAAIEVHAIGQHARSGEVTLRDVSLAVGHGELVAIIGGSGSGRTALLDAMSGRCPPSCGSVNRSAGNIGYVPQGDTIHPALPLARALRYAALLREVPAPDAAVDEALCALDLAGQSGAPVGELSGGERKRAAIAAELLAKPGLFFLDEPTSGLDPARGRELMRVLRRMCDNGITAVLTTQNLLDADRCDKVAVLANGGHLAFFGAPAAARDYFGADSLDEIYERLAGLGDPAAAWSRRFFHFSRTVSGVSPVPTVPSQPGPPRLVPDSAGPHSAGPVSNGLRAGALIADGLASDALARADASSAAGDSPALAGSAPVGAGQLSGGLPAGAGQSSGGPLAGAGQSSGGPPASGGVGGLARGAAARVLHPLRQWAVLTKRNADVLARARLTLAILAGAPVAVLLTFLVLFRPGAFDPARPSPEATVMIVFWAVFGGFFIGLCYGLPQICTEFGVLRRERSAGLGAGAYVLAKAAVLLPSLAVVDAVFLVVLRLLGRLPAGGDYAATFVTLLLSSAAALGLGLLISAAVAEPPQAMIAAPIVCFPQVLFAGAILPVPAMALVGRWISYAMTDRWAFEALGHSLGVRGLWASGRSPLGPPLLASYGTTFDRPVWGDWLILAGFVLAFFAAAIAVVARRTRVPAAASTASGYVARSMMRRSSSS